MEQNNVNVLNDVTSDIIKAMIKEVLGEGVIKWEDHTISGYDREIDRVKDLLKQRLPGDVQQDGLNAAPIVIKSCNYICDVLKDFRYKQDVNNNNETFTDTMSIYATTVMIVDVFIEILQSLSKDYERIETY